MDGVKAGEDGRSAARAILSEPHRVPFRRDIGSQNSHFKALN